MTLGERAENFPLGSDQTGFFSRRRECKFNQTKKSIRCHGGKLTRFSGGRLTAHLFDPGVPWPYVSHTPVPLSTSIQISRRRSETGVILNAALCRAYRCEKRVVSLAGQGDYIRLLQIGHRWMNFLLPMSASQLTSSLPFSFPPCQSPSFFSPCLLDGPYLTVS